MLLRLILCWSISTAFLSSALIAQEPMISLLGRVLESGSSIAIPYASVYLKYSTIGTTTNNEGEFLFHIPESSQADTLVISSIGYLNFEMPVVDYTNNQLVQLSPAAFALEEIVVTGEAQLSAKEIVRKAYAAIPNNYPTTAFVVEGFIRDLQNEDGAVVEFMECAVKFRYDTYADYYVETELLEVRRSYLGQRHPWNDDQERQNAIVDLLEDDCIRYDYGPILGRKGWSYELVHALPFRNKLVYEINAINPPFQTAKLFIDTETFAFVRIELERKRAGRRYYKDRLSSGQQEAAYSLIFEYQEIDGKMYPKYQKEEDYWQIFAGLETKKQLFEKYPKKELFVTKVITDQAKNYPFQKNLHTDESVEQQAPPFNPEFWKYYNAPEQTAAESHIIELLEKE